MKRTALYDAGSRGKWIYVVAGLLCMAASLYGQSAEGLSATLIDFIDEQENITRRIAEKALELHRRRFQLVRNCECSLSGCSSVFSDAPCDYSLGTVRICGKNQGRLLFTNISSFRMPAGENFVNPRDSIKENICVYRGLEEVFQELRKPNDPWMYFGSRDGHFRKYPAAADERLDKKSENPRSCSRYDPRVRPWYISASTGPKDVVIVIDKSNSMNEGFPNGGKSKWDITLEATLDILRLFTFADFVNVVAFSDDAVPLYEGETALVRGSSENIEKLREAAKNTFPEGSTNFTAAFTTAFRLLSDCTEEPKTCSNCQKIILFLTDGKDNTEDGESIKPSKMASIINDLQNDLSKKTKSRASIFTHSMTELADDNIPRQIACANRGAWSFIGPNTDALNGLNSYYLYVADSRRSSLPIWIEPYIDYAGLGLVTSVSMPVFAISKRKVKGAFLGVVGHDVTMAELRRDGATEREVLNAIVDRSERCSTQSNTQCDFQVIRNSTDPRAVCSDPYPSIPVLGRSSSNVRLAYTCYRHRQHFYKRIPTGMKWLEASKLCKDDNGKLAVATDREDLAFLANMAHPDGSWIGADNPSSNVYRWLDPSIPDIKPNSDYWGIGEPDAKGSEPHCISIDTRGVVSNLALRLCSEQQTAICRYTSEKSCVRVTDVPEEGYFVVPPLDECFEPESFVQSQPLAESAKLKTEDIICDFGDHKSTKKVTCCN